MAQLTAAQIATWKTHIAGNTAETPQYPGIQIKALDITNGDHVFAISQWYNQTATPDFIVWRDLPMETVLGVIVYANMTPADSPDGTQLWANRSLACQGKQFNLQNLTIGRTSAPMKRANYRAALQDCLTNLPAGAGGSSIAAGWVAVRDAAKSQATRLEQVLATGSGTTASPSDLTFEGSATLPI